MNNISTILTMNDRLGAWKVRWGIHRMEYTIEPGIYAVNTPDADSIVLVSANYKLSFDVLRSHLEGLDAWILVLDTKGVNVWCAAGKGTFGTDELVERIESSGLAGLVRHRTLIVPQLGAVGIAAHEVRKQSGFSVLYGPVRAADIKQFINAGMKATENMRQVRFSFYDRLVLTPVEFVNNFKYLLLTIILFFALSGLGSGGFSSRLMLQNGIISAAIIFSAYVSGAVLGPLLLPWILGRSFALKGAMLGLFLTAILWGIGLTGHQWQTVAWSLLIIPISSFLVMGFTGASTYTSLSGVRKEMRIAVPLQMLSAAAGVVLLVINRFV
ncbi:MAG: mercury methylation corrinoid protein HgcA [Sedimentisphaerales bacterium]|nr:mercury methylation corrinoid protein HgcA [Sedimentisphaerales bacterium]